MQNLLGLAGMVKSGTIYQPAGDQKASHIDTADIAAVAAKVLTSAGHEGKAYTLTGPEAVSFDEIAEILLRVTGKPVKYQDVPRDAGKQAMEQSGMSEWQAESVSQLMDDYREGKMAKVSGDVEKVTGRKAKSVQLFIAENAAAFMS